MTTSGQTFFASLMSCSLCKPWSKSAAKADHDGGGLSREEDAYSSAGLVVACDHDLFLLHSQRQSFQGRSFILDDGGVEAVLRSDGRELPDAEVYREGLIRGRT